MGGGRGRGGGGDGGRQKEGRKFRSLEAQFKPKSPQHAPLGGKL